MADVVFTRDIKIHCFIGGRANPQCEALAGAKLDLISKFGVICQFTDVDIDYVRMEHWSEKDLVDWLLEGDIHLLICHPHQGREKTQLERPPPT